MFQPEILLAFGHVVVEENETVQVGGPDRQTHAAHAGAFHWIEYVAESRCTGFGRHSHEHLGAAARQGEAETIDRLETLPRVDDDIGTATAAVVAYVGKLVLFGFGVKRGAVGKRNVGTDGLCGCRDGHARQSAGQKEQFAVHDSVGFMGVLLCRSIPEGPSGLPIGIFRRSTAVVEDHHLSFAGRVAGP